MVDYSDLVNVNQLVDEYRAIEDAVLILRDGGRIANIQVITAEDAAIGRGAQIPTLYMATPPQMMTSIIQLAEARKEQIYQDLAELGLTGLVPREPPPSTRTPTAARGQPARVQR